VPYIHVADFKAGLSNQRLITTAAPATLRTLTNAHVNRGGEIQKRKAFASYAVLPAGTIGLAAIGGRLYVFGTPVDPGVPSSVTYQRLVPSGGVSVTRILDVKGSAGKLYVSALCSDDLVRHFYDGTQVTAFTGQTPAERGRILLPFGGNMYAASGRVLHRSKANLPADWVIGTGGSAFFDMSSQATGSEDLTGLSEYQSQVAVFSRRTTQIWSFDPDAAASAKLQTLRNTGCVAPLSVVPFGGGDVFFLSDAGVRSLRSRDITDSPVAADVGTPIDDAVVEWLRTATVLDMETAHAIIEPTDGRYWLVLGSTVYVFSYFPGSKISAWSTYTLPATPTATVAVDRQVFTRIGDAIYLMGGATGSEYDSTSAIVETPFLDARGIATWKEWLGIDIAAEGTWDVYAALNPSDPTVEDLIGQLSGSTFHQLDTAMLGASPHVKLRLVSVGSGAAKLGAITADFRRV
jgi:hypothetical protein